MLDLVLLVLQFSSFKKEPLLEGTLLEGSFGFREGESLSFDSFHAETEPAIEAGTYIIPVFRLLREKVRVFIKARNLN